MRSTTHTRLAMCRGPQRCTACGSTRLFFWTPLSVATERWACGCGASGDVAALTDLSNVANEIRELRANMRHVATLHLRPEVS